MNKQHDQIGANHDTGFGGAGDTPSHCTRKSAGAGAVRGGHGLPGMLRAKVLRSPYAHARILHIDSSAALALPGVKAVVTGADTPARMWGVARDHSAFWRREKCVLWGEEVAAVVAVDEDTARDALDLIHVEYEELAPQVSAETAFSQGSPEVHAGTGNLADEISIARGDVDAGFAQADIVHEATYQLHSQYPGYMEPMGTVAEVDGNGRRCGLPRSRFFLARSRMAEALDRPVSTIRVIQATVGGGFGGKIVEERTSVIAAFLATRVERPVRLVNNRLEDFQSGCFSVPCKIALKMGMTRDGRITAKDVKILADCGAYAGLAPEVMLVTAMRSDNMQRIENVPSLGATGLHPQDSTRRVSWFWWHTNVIRAQQPHGCDGHHVGAKTPLRYTVSTPFAPTTPVCTGGR